jgi:hypothetical protein
MNSPSLSNFNQNWNVPTNSMKHSNVKLCKNRLADSWAISCLWTELRKSAKAHKNCIQITSMDFKMKHMDGQKLLLNYALIKNQFHKLKIIFFFLFIQKSLSVLRNVGIFPNCEYSDFTSWFPSITAVIIITYVRWADSTEIGYLLMSCS